MLRAIFGGEDPRKKPPIPKSTPTDARGREIKITPELFDRLFEKPKV